MNHSVQVKVIAIYGVTVFDKNMKRIDDEGGRTSKGQVSCVVGLSRNKSGMKSEKSLPLRQKRASPYKGNGALWPRDTSVLCLDTKLNGKKQKTFEISIMLDRGKEQILIGIASLKFLSTVLETEIDIPIHTIASKSAVQIQTSARTRCRRRMIGRSTIQDSFFQSNPYTVVNGIRTVSFTGGDNGRRYALDRGAFIRLKCSCIPKSGMIDIVHLESLLSQKTNSRDNSILLQNSSFVTLPSISTTPKFDGYTYQHLQNHYGLDDVLMVGTNDSMTIRRKMPFDDRSAASASHRSSLYSDMQFSYGTQEKASTYSKRNNVFEIKNYLGRLLGPQCMGRLTSRCIYEASKENTKTVNTNNLVPSAVRYDVVTKESVVSELASPEHLTVAVTSSSMENDDRSIDDNTMYSDREQMTIPKQESFGTEFFANVLGIDIKELKQVWSDRLICNKAQDIKPSGSFSKYTMRRSLLTDSSTYDTDSTHSSDTEEYTSYSSQTSYSYY